MNRELLEQMFGYDINLEKLIRFLMEEHYFNNIAREETTEFIKLIYKFCAIHHFPQETKASDF